MERIKMTKFTKVIGIWTILLFVVSIIGIIVSLVNDLDKQIVIRLAFNIIQCVIMFVCLLVPHFLTKTTKIKIPSKMEMIYVAFCTGSFILGEINDFYAKFVWWDSLLHAMSGILLGALGFIILNTMNHVEEKHLRFDPLFASSVVVCFALSIGVVWEFIEYMIDDIFGANMQQFMTGTGTLDQGEPLVGHDALRDTMKDLFLAFCGSLGVAIIGFLELKHAKKGISTMELEIEKSDESSKKEEQSEKNVE